MKIRQSFVTNSSSSSFIISSKSKNNKLKMVVEMDLDKLADKKISTIEELNKWVKYNYDYDPNDPNDPDFDDYFEEEYNKMKKAIESGADVYVGWASNESDEAIEQFIYHEGFKNVQFPDGVELIYGEE